MRILNSKYRSSPRVNRIAAVFFLLAGLLVALSIQVYRIRHPDLTATQLVIDTWRESVIAVGLCVAGLFCYEGRE